MNIKKVAYNLSTMTFSFIETKKRISWINKHYDYSSLTKVRISIRDTAFYEYIKLQTPQQLGVWGHTAFVFTWNPDLNLVINRPNPFVPLSSDIRKNWLLHMEPPQYIQKLGLNTEKILKKFDFVFTSDPRLYEKGGKFVASPPYVQWNLAINAYTKNRKNLAFDYDFLLHQRPPVKNVNLVTLNSAMNDLPGHRVRADFIIKLAETNTNFELYGSVIWSNLPQYKGTAENGKWPIYSPAKYVLVIENEIADYYWSEKFTDALLCFCIPIYYGCPRINQYFPAGSYIYIDVTKASAIDELNDILSSDFYEKNYDKLIEARNLVLTNHNLFNFIDTTANHL